MDNVTVDKLKRLHGDDAGRVFEQIADLGGYGKVGDREGHINPGYEGGLDIKGVLDANNTAVSDSAKAKIAELAGVSDKDRGDIDAGKAGVSSADKMNKGKQ